METPTATLPTEASAPEPQLPPVAPPEPVDFLLRISRYWLYLVSVIVFLVVAALVYACIGTYINTSNHTSDLNKISSIGQEALKVANEVHKQQLEDNNGKETTKADAKQIGAAVALAEAEIAGNHASSGQDFVSLCNTLNGLVDALHLDVAHCTVPSVTGSAP